MKSLQDVMCQLNLQIQRIKKAALCAALFKLGAQEGTRTPTTLRSPAPEAGASTNFATWACLYYRGMGISRSFLAPFGFFPSDLVV